MVVPEPAPLIVIGENIKIATGIESQRLQALGISSGRKRDNVIPGKCIRFGNGRPQRTSTAGIGTNTISGGCVLRICGCIYDKGCGVCIQGETYCHC